MKINIIKEETASLTGHRPKSLPWGYNENLQYCLKFKSDLKQVLIAAINYGLTTFLTGMAEGFDMIATEILLELRETYKIRIIAVIPCLDQEIKWKPEQQARYRKIIEQCDDKIILSKQYTQTCMNDRNKYMVEHSSVCIAYWNGKPSGTGNTIGFAEENGLKIINLYAQKDDVKNSYVCYNVEGI